MDSFWWRVGVSLVLAGQAGVFGLGWNIAEETPPLGSPVYWTVHGAFLLSALLVMALLGGPLARETVRTIGQRKVTIEALFSLSLLGALGGSMVASLTATGSVYYEVVAIVLIVYSIGKRLGERSRQGVLSEVDNLRERYEYAWVEQSRGGRQRVPVSELVPGATVVIAPGEPVTVDGLILDGVGEVAEAALTGEPGPRLASAGERLRAGAWSVDGTFRLRVEATSPRRELDRILQDVAHAQVTPSRLQTDADAVVRWFVPVVVTISLATLGGWILFSEVAWWRALFHSMAVLLVACPCALGLATPLAVWGAMMRLAESGLTPRNGTFIDALARADGVVFDKTGTLTREALRLGSWRVREDWLERYQLLAALTSKAEEGLSHPVARALVEGLEPVAAPTSFQLRQRQLLPGGIVTAEITASTDPKIPDSTAAETTDHKAVEKAGAGTGAKTGFEAGGSVGKGRTGHAEKAETYSIRLGNVTSEEISAGFVAATETPISFESNALDIEERDSTVRQAPRRQVGLWWKEELVAVFDLMEDLRPASEEVLRELSAMGLPGMILSGDTQPSWKSLGEVAVEGGLSPAAKAERVRALAASGRRLLYVGDGLNDAGAMQAAEGSLAMDQGAGLAREAADAVLQGDTLSPLPKAVRLCREVRSIVRANLNFALIYNILGMGLAAAGILHPVVAALLMVGSSAWVSSRAMMAVRQAGGEHFG